MEIVMRPMSFVIELPRQRRRAVELYSHDTPFRHRVEQSKTQYRRRPKHVNKALEA
jgi:stalled ribosome alternative rescue factor ArfA